MDAATAVALTSVLLATIIAVAVPVMTFRLALRQDGIRWLREQRAQLYVDLLAEAHAEEQYLEFAMADAETRDEIRARFHATDTRLPPLERARLGARGTIFGSRTVNRLFSRIGYEGGQAMLNLGHLPPEALRLQTRMRVGAALDELQAAVRSELGADRIQLETGPLARDMPLGSRPRSPGTPQRADAGLQPEPENVPDEGEPESGT